MVYPFVMKYPKSQEDYTKYLVNDVKNIKIGVPKEFYGEGINEEVKQSLECAIQKYKELGAEIEEFFDEKYIRENLIENFNPHDEHSSVYDTSKSKYYRLILQNLFFAMLNCPIATEEKANNRCFRKGRVRKICRGCQIQRPYEL